jgi:hypothetical protein
MTNPNNNQPKNDQAKAIPPPPPLPPPPRLIKEGVEIVKQLKKYGAIAPKKDGDK